MAVAQAVPKVDDVREKIVASRKAVARRITEFYTALGISRVEFFRAIGMNYNTLQSYVGGRSEPGSLFFTRLIEEYPLADIGFILTGVKTSMEGFVKADLIPFSKLPIVDTIPAEGFTKSVDEEYIIDWMYTTKTETASTFAFLVRGEGFAPDAKDGSIIILAPTDIINPGELYLVLTKTNGLVLKRVYKSEKGYRLAPPSSADASVAVSGDEIGKIFQVIEISTHFVR
jgi:SOS-response transcriptional repressor LexA